MVLCGRDKYPSQTIEVANAASRLLLGSKCSDSESPTGLRLQPQFFVWCTTFCLRFYYISSLLSSIHTYMSVQIVINLSIN